MENKLYNLFKSIMDNKASLVNCGTGDSFEGNIIDLIGRRTHFTKLTKEIMKEDLGEAKTKSILSNIQNILPNHWPSFEEIGITEREYAYFEDKFIPQPYGSQQIPDLLFFYNQRVIAIEIKYTNKDQRKPVWNGHPAHPNIIYIFGSYSLGDLTFWNGEDIVSPKLFQILNEKLDFLSAQTKQINNEINKMDVANPFGFQLYFRRTVNQKKVKNGIVNFFDNKQRDSLERNVFNKIESLQGGKNKF